MSDQTLQSRAAWALVRRQFGVITHAQLIGLGFGPSWIKARLAAGRLHRLFRGVYAVGRPEVTREGWWMAATLACGEASALSHESGAALYGIHEAPDRPVHVSVPLTACRSREGIAVHRRALADHEKTEHEGIRVVAIEVVLADLAIALARGPLEAALNEADVRGLITMPRLRERVGAMPRRAGRKPLRETIDRRTFRFTRSGLERAFIPLVLSAGLSRPATRVVVDGFEVDFFWPELGLVVETDGLTYHRTAQAQAKDRLRDQAHIAAGLTPLRFTHSQIRYEPDYVVALLRRVARRLAKERGRELQELRHG